jgi:hypothetical protein
VLRRVIPGAIEVSPAESGESRIRAESFVFRQRVYQRGIQAVSVITGKYD